MIQNFRGKSTKDIEAASDTIIHNTEFTNSTRGKSSLRHSISSSLQQSDTETFDNFIEKKNKKFN